MQLLDVINALEEIAPTRQAEPWDNVGLLAGDPAQPVGSALLTIDYTRAVAAEAEALGCELVIAYHPPIFEPLKRITAGNLVFDALRRGTALYSPHTALDIAPGGTNDMLADILGLEDRKPLRPAEARDREYKLITFVPAEHLEPVSQALFDAGCGRIGDYSHCSFRSPGTGTFFGDQTTKPAVGQAGRFETADEIRIETIVPIQRLTEALQALQQAHPYETPAFDLVRLAAAPDGSGMGRIGRIAGDAPRGRRDLIEHVRRALGVDHLLVAGPLDGKAQTAACCAGACGKLLDDAIRQRADVYLTGEMRHHDALRAAAAGMTVICALHSHSERKVLARLAARLSESLNGLTCHLSKQDDDPFRIV